MPSVFIGFIPLSNMTSLLPHQRSLILQAAAALLSLATPVLASAQATTPAAIGTIIVAHGGGPGWNAQVEEVARAVRTDGPVRVAFLMGGGAANARFQDVVRDLERERVGRIVVVPMLVSSHSGHYDQIRYLAGEPVSLDSVMLHHLHMAGIQRASTRVPITVTPAIDDAPAVARVLADRALAIEPHPAGQALFIVGHGPNSAEDYAAWMGNLRVVADSVKRLTGFADVRVDLVRDDAPRPVRAEAVRRVRDLIELQRGATGRDVVVVPVLVATGEVSRVKIRKDLAGLPVRYTGDALLAHPAMARWVEQRVKEAATDLPPTD
jgi:sirohydrochlorin cobaltochelatase